MKATIYKAFKKDVKLEAVLETANTNRNSKVSDAAFDLVEKSLLRNNIELTALEKLQFLVPNTEAASILNAWMKNFFETVGDKRKNEIHLDSNTIKQVLHAEYKSNIKDWFGVPDKELLSYETFIRVWNLCYDHVKIRDQKATGSKCDTCEKITAYRRNISNYEARLRASELHAYHRHMYMGEKTAYHDRAIQAIMKPAEYGSIIGDGMDKEKTKLPQLEMVLLIEIYIISSLYLICLGNGI